MLFKLHYFLMAAGYNAMGILLGVYFRSYTDATNTEIGLLYMVMPFIGMACKPIISSFADRNQAHRAYLMICLMSIAICYLPFVVIPFLGPEVYERSARVCFYFLVVFKVVGDVSYGCAITIGDSLVVNYCKRIGNELCYYRIGGAISWTVFGLIVGQLNEIWFLPKYVAGFVILITTSLLDMFLMYLWPREYFEMTTTLSANTAIDESERPTNPWTKSLMSRHEVWLHARHKLKVLATFSCLAGSESQQLEAIDKQSFNGEGNRKNCDDHSLPPPLIGKKTQLAALALLLRRDLRICGYLLTFVLGGALVMPLSFFLMSLSDICHTNNSCNFSQLVGLLQVSMSISEIIWILHMDRIVRAIGRVNTFSLAFALFGAKYLFYGTLFAGVNPHYSIILEAQSGITHGIFFILMNELGHSFAAQVEQLVPELIERGVLEAKDEERARQTLSLSATMQALFSSAYEGLGRGLAALAYGYIVDFYSFETLWLIVSFIAFCALVALQTINLIGFCHEPGSRLGRDRESQNADKESHSRGEHIA